MKNKSDSSLDPRFYEPVVCEERRRRIRVSLSAWAYERYDAPILTDAEFDKMCGQIDVNIETGRPDLDRFFKEQFNPSTGQWIYQHPDLAMIDALVRVLHLKK